MSDISSMTNSDIVAKLISLRNDPTAVQEFSLNMLDAASEGSINLPDANSPFFYALENAALLATSTMQHDGDLMAAFYPKMANSYDDLYRWMSDDQYPGRFATPSRLYLMFVINADEVRARAVPVSPDSTDALESVYSKVVIPRNSQFMIAGYTFSMEYPIEIRIMKHGGFVIVYDTTEKTPLLTLEDNQLQKYTQTLNGNEYLGITAMMRQIATTAYYSTVTKSSGFKATYALNGDMFYAVRAFVRNNVDADWVECEVTHSAQIYDNSILTFVAKVLEDTVVVSLPDIYVNNGLGVNKLVRIDVVTTNGALSIEPSTVTGATVTANWLDYNYPTGKVSRFAAPFIAINEKTLQVTTSLVGGANEKTVAQVRKQVIYAANNTVYPITAPQLSSTLSDMGYDILKVEDTPTSRVYQVTREIPKQTTKNMNTSIGSCVVTLIMTTEQLTAYNAVKDNGNRVTITPDALYRVVNGVYTMLTDAERSALNRMTLDERAKRVNENQYLYTPFYYVLDVTDNILKTRAYELDNPVLSYKSFNYENNSVGVNVSTASTTFAKTENGYTFAVVTSSDDIYKGLSDDDVMCQMLFTPEGESDYAYLNGVITGRTADNERIWTFTLNTNMDVDDEDHLIFTSFAQYGNAPTTFDSLLSNSFTVLFMIGTAVSPNTVVYSDSDDKQGKWYLNQNMVVVTDQSYQLKFGDALTYLYTRQRPTASAVQYLTYTDDEPWRYSADVYEKTTLPNGQEVLVFDADNNPILEHAAGDIMYDDEGLILIRYEKGAYKRDPNGNLIPVNARSIQNEFDIIVFDAIYYFTSNTLDEAYVASVDNTLVEWVTSDMVTVNGQMGERTEARLLPKKTMGVVDVIVNAKESRQIEASIPLEITLYLTENGYKNASLRESLVPKIKTTIVGIMRNETWSLSDIIDEVSDYKTDEVTEIDVTPVGVGNDIKVISMVDSTMRCAVKKRLEAMPDGTLSVGEDITINFLKQRDAKSAIIAS